MSVLEAAWVIARRDFVASVYSRSFILFLIVPLAVFAAMILLTEMAREAGGTESGPVVAVVADTDTVEVLMGARTRLVAATSENHFPKLQAIPPAENVSVQARQLLADQDGGYSAVLSGTLDRPVLTGPAKIDEFVGERVGLIVEEARQTAALQAAGASLPPLAVERVVTDQAAGNLQMIRRDLARGVISVVFGIIVLLATLMLSNLAEERSNKVIEVLASAVPLDAIFLGKLIAMLGISFVGLALWGGTFGLAYLFFQVVQDFMTLPQAGPALGWAGFTIVSLLYYGTNFLLFGALFLGIGAQASNIRDIQTLSMPVTLLQVVVFLVCMTVVGREDGALVWFAHIFPFSSPMTMTAFAAQYDTLWPHLLALVWQAVWVVLIIRISARLFRRTVLKSSSGGGFFSFGASRRAGAPAE